MFDGPSLVRALKTCGITDVVWLPDSDLGRWDQALAGDPDLRLIRVCREGEAMAIAGGLLMGGRRPIVLLQCTGLFEAGDSLRNIVHDLGLPLFLLVGVRGWRAHRHGGTSDNCPRFVEPIVRAWGLEYRWLDEGQTPDDLAAAYLDARSTGQAGVVLYAE
jgi:sulfopyruvate decarboxylase TPP-binding subunit